MSTQAVRIIGSSEGAADNQFSMPRGICVCSRTKQVFVVDSNNNRVQVFDLRSLAYIRTIGDNHIHTLAFTAAGYGGMDLNINDRVLGNPMSCCVDNSGRLYVSDTNSHRIAVFDQETGDLLRTISRQGSLAGFVNKPCGLALDLLAGHLYVADCHNHRVQVFDKDSGTFVRSIGLYGTTPGNAIGQFNEPVDVALDSENKKLLVADFLNDRIQVFHQHTGAHMHTIGGEGTGEFRGPRGIYVDRGSNLIFIADRENHRIKIFNRNTYAPIRSFTGGNTGPGMFNRPMEMCVAMEEGVLLVVDASNHRVQVIAVEELQEQKFRYQARMRSRKSAEEKYLALPKASRTACSADLASSNTIRTRSGSMITLNFPEFGPLFSVRIDIDDLAGGDVSVLKRTLPQLSSSSSESGVQDVSSAQLGTSFDKSSTPGVGSGGRLDNSIMTAQAEAFMGVIASLRSELPLLVSSSKAETNASDDDIQSSAAHMQLIVPSALALHSLLERKWTPRANGIPMPVIASLTAVLADLNHASVSHEEKARVVRAVTAILRGAAQSGTDTENYVYASVLQSLQTLTEPWYEVLPEYLRDSQDGNGSSVMSGTGVGGSNLASSNRSTMSPGPHSPHRKKSAAPSSPPSPIVYLGDAAYAHLRLLSDMLATQADPQDDKSKEYASAYHKDVVRLVLGPAYAECSDPPVSFNLFNLPSSGLLTPGSTHGFSTPMSSLAGFGGETSSMKKIGDNWSVAEVAAGAGFASNTSTPFVTPTKQIDRMSPVREIHLPVQQGLQSLLDVVFRLKRLRQRAESSIDPATDAVLQDLSISALNSAAEYFSTSQQQEERRKSNSTSTDRKTRGGANIWRAGEQMCVGDLVDAMDKEKCWFESIITEVRPGMNIKVHFMGWGSKWDDIIPIEELETRISCLNSQTKNWRADLFEGGLIEIKCNEDTVHQKWMWGKIIAMSVEEEWVDVSYNFSNEPVILKRAKLYGETICPVGMHTKERSKAVLATIVRPPQKAEDLVTKKRESGEDAAYQDREDELAWADSDFLQARLSSDDEWAAHLDESGSDSYCHYSELDGKGNEKGSNGTHRKHKAVKTRDAEHVVRVNPSSSPVDLIAVQVFQCLMQEVLYGVTSGLPTSAAAAEEVIAAGEVMSTIEHMSQSPQFKAAEAVLKVLIDGPHKKLLAPYFCRVIIFQCSLRTKVLAQVYLATSTPHISTIDDCLFSAITLRQIQALETLYAQLLVRCLGDYLSANLLCKVLQRLQATIAHSALSVLASSFASQLCASPPRQLRQVLLHGCLHSPDRFNGGGVPSAVRDVLSRLLSCSSAYDLRRIASVWVNALAGWVLERCERDFSTEVKPFLFIEASTGTAAASAVSEAKEADECPHPFALIDDLLEMLTSARSASRLEFRESSGACHMAAEIAFSQAFSSLPLHALTAISRLLALRVSTLLDLSGKIYADACMGTFRDAQYSLSRQQRTELLDRTLDLVKISLSERTAAPFRMQYEALMPARLLAGCSSLVEERASLKELPSIPRGFILLADIEAAGSYMLEFKKYLVGRLDREELNYDDHAASLNLVFRASGTRSSKVNICAVSAGLWPAHCTQMSLYASLKLPAPLALIAREFESFFRELPTTWPLCDVQDFAEAYSDQQTGLCCYKFDYRSILQASSSVSVLGTGKSKNESEINKQKRLYWCHGSGAVDLALVFRLRERYTCTVNEPLAAVLLVIGAEKTGRCSAAQLSKATNLTVACVQDLCSTLCASRPPLLTSSRGPDDDVYSVNAVLLSTDALKRSRKAPSNIEIPASSRGAHLLVEQERKWLECVLDASIVRCLKKALVGEQGSLLACVTSTSIPTTTGNVDVDAMRPFTKSIGTNTANAKTNFPMLVPALSADELCLCVKKALEAAGQVAEPVSSKKILARCEVLTSTGLLRKVCQHRGPRPPEWAPANIGLASMVGGGVHCVGYVYAVEGNPYSAGNSSQSHSYKKAANCIISESDTMTRSISLLAEKGGRVALYPRLLRTLNIYHANASSATVSLKHFSSAFAAWVGDLALGGLANAMSGPSGMAGGNNARRLLNRHCGSSRLNAMQALAAERESWESTQRSSSNSSVHDTERLESRAVRRWTDPLQSSDIRSIISGLALVSGVCVTQLASLELQYQHADMSSPAALAAFHNVAAPVNDFVSAVHMLASCTAPELAVKLEEIDFYLLCFEALSPKLIRAALHLLFAVSSEPCPAPEADITLSPQQLLVRMRPHWRRKHVVLSAHLRRVGVQLGCEELIEALHYVGSAEPVLQVRDKPLSRVPGPSGTSAGAATGRSAENNGDSDEINDIGDGDRAEEKGVPSNASKTGGNSSDSRNSSSSTWSPQRADNKRAAHGPGILYISLRDVFCAVMELDEQASLAALAASKEQVLRESMSQSAENAKNAAVAKSSGTASTAAAGGGLGPSANTNANTSTSTSTTEFRATNSFNYGGINAMLEEEAKRRNGNASPERAGTYGNAQRAREQTVDLDWARRAALLMPPAPPFPDVDTTHIAPSNIEIPLPPNMRQQPDRLMPGGHGYVGLNGVPLYNDPNGIPQPHPMHGGMLNRNFFAWNAQMEAIQSRQQDERAINDARGSEEVGGGLHGLIPPNMPHPVPQPGHFAPLNTANSAGSGSTNNERSSHTRGNASHLTGMPMMRHMLSLAVPAFGSMGLGGPSAMRPHGLFSPMASSSSSNDFPTYFSSPRSDTGREAHSYGGTPVPYDEDDAGGRGRVRDNFPGADIELTMDRDGDGDGDDDNDGQDEDDAVTISLSLHDLLLMFLSACDCRFREAFPAQAAADEREAESKSTGASVASSPSTSVSHFLQDASMMHATVAAMTDSRDANLGSLAFVVPNLCFRLLDATMNVLSHTVANNNAAAAAAEAALMEQEKHLVSESSTYSDSLDTADEEESCTRTDKTYSASTLSSEIGITTQEMSAPALATAASLSRKPVFRTSLRAMLDTAFQMMDPEDSGYLTAASFEAPTVPGASVGSGRGSASSEESAGATSATYGLSNPNSDSGTNITTSVAETTAEQKLHQHLNKYIYSMLKSLELNDLHAELNALKALLPRDVPTHIALHMLYAHECNASLAADAFWVLPGGLPVGDERYSYAAKHPNARTSNASSTGTKFMRQNDHISTPKPPGSVVGGVGVTAIPSSSAANVLFSPLLTAMNGARAKPKQHEAPEVVGKRTGTSVHMPAAPIAAQSFAVIHTQMQAQIPKSAQPLLPRCSSCNMVSSATDLLAVDCGHWHCRGCWTDFFNAAVSRGCNLRCSSVGCNKQASVDFQAYLACCTDPSAGSNTTASSASTSSAGSIFESSDVHVQHLKRCVTSGLQHCKGRYALEMQASGVIQAKLQPPRVTSAVAVPARSEAGATLPLPPSTNCTPPVAIASDEASLFAQRARSDLLELLQQGTELVSLCMRYGGIGTCSGAGAGAGAAGGASSGHALPGNTSTRHNSNISTTAGSVSASQPNMSFAIGSPPTAAASNSTSAAEGSSTAAIAASRAHTINTQVTALIGQLPASLTQLHRLLHGPRSEEMPPSLHDSSAQELADCIRVQITGTQTLVDLLQVPAGAIVGVQNLASTYAAMSTARMSGSAGALTGTSLDPGTGTSTGVGARMGFGQRAGSMIGNAYMHTRNGGGSGLVNPDERSGAGGSGNGSGRTAGGINNNYSDAGNGDGNGSGNGNGNVVFTHLLGAFGVDPMHIYDVYVAASAGTAASTSAGTASMKHKRE